MHETQQLDSVVKWVGHNLRGKIILWGRSMGAFVALRYQIEFSGAHALVLDSPYHCLTDLIAKTVERNSLVPGFLAEGGVRIIRDQLNEGFGFDIEELSILPKLHMSKVAVVFICSSADELSGEATETLYKEYSGKKTLIYTEKKHD